MRYLALLRGVNVGGVVLKMDELRCLLLGLGFEKVETYIQSGNAIFESAAREASALEAAIGMAIGATVLAFLIATPGALLQTDAFMRDFKYEALQTSQGHGLTFVSTGPGFV